MTTLIRAFFAALLISLSMTAFSMNLRLKYPPTPEYAAKHAEVAVDAVKRIEGVTLDYSPASLGEIDKIIQDFHKQGLSDDKIGETVFVFGCYAGEVFVRNRKAVWANPADVMPAGIAKNFPFMVVKLPGGQVWSPITKAFGELHNGSEDSLAFLYQAAAAKP